MTNKTTPMTDEQINIAIAEACGVAHEDKWGSMYKTPHGYVRDVPDYCNDLNAMHEAVNTLKRASYVSWCNHLMRICEGDSYVNATAYQRAEAFLRTVNK